MPQTTILTKMLFIRTVLSAALVLLLALVAHANDEDRYTLSGYVRDATNGETIIGATITAEGVPSGAITNVYGFYSLSLPEGTYTITWSFLGYESVTEKINLTENVKRNIELKETSAVTEVVEVVGDKRKIDNVGGTEMSVARLDIEAINKIPALLGEVDIVRAIQLLPGVTTVGEGASGFNVRGGNVDQNLVLMDEAPVYNSSHLFGLFSVFNPDAVKDVKLYKGGIPSQFGGRLSSILDVRLKEGNTKKFSGQGGLGIVFSRLTLEAPIDSGKGSFIVAGRRSYGDLFLKLAPDEDLRNTIAYFYDLTGKANYEINERNRVFISAYLGRDRFGFGDVFGFDWGNATTSIRWNHLFSDRLFLNTTVFYSNYDYALLIEDDGDVFNWRSRIINYSAKPEFTYYLNNKNTITFGAQTILYDFQPGNFVARSQGVETTRSLPSKWAFEHAFYVGNDQKLTDRLSLQYGLRYSLFDYVGPGTTYDVGPRNGTGSREIFNPEGRDFERLDLIQRYDNWEPRASMGYKFNEKSSVKASYNRMSQYIHLISNTTAVAPLDVWTPSTNNIKPQIADQWAVGYFRDFGSMFETSAEVFYKDMFNQLDYVDGANLLLNPFLEGELLPGTGRAYGLELYLRKITGRFTGFISYTLSRTERRVEGINNNEWYDSRFDRRHNLNLVGSYSFTDRLEASSNLVILTGIPATFPDSRFEFEGIPLPNNSLNQRNNFRVPDYYRLDLSVTLKNKKKERTNRIFKDYQSSWVFSAYNVTARRNPFGIYIQNNPDNPQITEAVRFSVFGTIIPAVSYNFSF